MTATPLDIGGLPDVVGWIIAGGAVAAALVALGRVARGAYRVVRRIMRVVDLISDELRPNGGGSVKDRSDQSAVSLRELGVRLGRLEGQVATIARQVSREDND